MALKLQVPWIREPLPVQYRGIGGVNGVISDIVASGSPHVCQVGADVLVVNFFGECNRVPDVSRYRISEGGCCVPDDYKYRISNDKYIIPHRDISGLELQLQLLQPQIGSIVLLLESPHRDEYQPGNINSPIAPANGATGHNIDQCLGKVLSHINAQNPIEPGSHIIISNPIQFQTSLHAIHGKSSWSDSRWGTLRNHVWRKLWGDQHMQQCFRERLKSYKPSLIINACTAELKSHINGFFQNVEEWQNVTLREVPHPGDMSWNNCDNILPIPPANQNAVDPQQ